MKIIRILKTVMREKNVNKDEHIGIDIMDIQPIRDKLYLPHSINAWYTTTLNEPMILFNFSQRYQALKFYFISLKAHVQIK